MQFPIENKIAPLRMGETMYTTFANAIKCTPLWEFFTTVVDVNKIWYMVYNDTEFTTDYEEEVGF